ncbi:MAG: hypothetical protein QXH24_02005 [Candidatus Bathyarchaeia archaeon]
MSQTGPPGLEELLPKMVAVGLIAYTVGLLMDGISNILWIATWVTLLTILLTVSGIIELGIAGLLLMRMKYILSLSAFTVDTLFVDPTLKYLLYLVPLYLLLKGIGFLQSTIVTGIGLIGAAILIFITLFLRVKPMSPSTAILTNFILTLLIGAFLGLAGFSMAGSSMPNTLLMYSGILGIAIIIIGLSILMMGLAPKAEAMKDVMVYIGYLLIVVALIVGGALAIRDGVYLTYFPGVIGARGAITLVAGILGGILTGVLSIIVIVMKFTKVLARISEIPPPPPPPT